MAFPPENRAKTTPAVLSGSSKTRTTLKILVAAGLLAWLVGTGRLDLHALLATPLSTLHLLGILVLFIGMVLQAWRWWWLLAVQGIDLSFPRTLGLVWIGRFLAVMLPGVVGGDLVRGYYVTLEAPAAKTAGVSTVVLDRMMGFVASFVLGLFALAWMSGSHEPWKGPVLHVGAVSVLCVFGASLAFLALWIDPVRNRILGFVPGRYRGPLKTVLEGYRGRGRTLWACLALSLAIGFMGMGAFVVAGHLIGSPVGWKRAFLVCPLVFVATALPLSPSGIGVGETAASVLFAQFGVETGATLMLIVRLWFLVLQLPGGLLYVLRRGRPQQAAE